MSAKILSFTPRQTKPVDYRSPDQIEVHGLMVRWFGYSTDPMTGERIGNATLTDFENNRSTDLPLVVKDVESVEGQAIIEALASGEVVAVLGFCEMIGGASQFVVTAVTEFRKRDQVREATVRAYFINFETESQAAQG